MLRFIVLGIVALIMLSSCGSGRVVVEKDRYREEERNNHIVQKYIAESMDVSDNFRMLYTAEMNDELTEDEKTDELVETYLMMLASEQAGGVPVAELNMGDILAGGGGIIGDILRGVVDFAADYLTKEKVPQPFNIFRQAKFGRKMWREKKEERDKY